MEGREDCKRLCILLLVLFIIAATSSTQCDARRSLELLKGARQLRGTVINKHTKKLRMTKHFDLASLILQKEVMDPSNTDPYVSSPFTLPPYNSLSPENAPPYCTYPPNTPAQTPPSTTIPTPIGYAQTPPPPPFYYLPSPPEFGPYPPEIVPSPVVVTPSPPEVVPEPPTIIGPGPPLNVPSPPYYEPSPPSYVPSPPTFVPSPTGFIPSPPLFLPPVVFPPPMGPPPRGKNPPTALWCVAKPSVPEPIIQEAMNYACGSGADCQDIQPSGMCYEPNTVVAHASYAFNSYWQRTKVAGGTCSFGGTAILVTVDPSYDGCRFLYV